LQVELDVLTGEKMVLSADILFDCGHSLNPAVDIGQASTLPKRWHATVQSLTAPASFGIKQARPQL
jgi:hypothetical protein